MDPKKNVNQGLVDFFYSLASCSPLKGAMLDGQRQLYFSGINFVSGSGVFDFPFFSEISEVKIKALLNEFKEKKVPFIWWGGSDKLLSFGFQKGGEMTGIYAKVPDLPKLDSIHIEKAVSLEQLEVFSGLMGEIFGMNPQVQDQLKRVHFAASEMGKQQHYIAYHNEKPVSILTISLTGNTAGIWNLATLESKRGKGFATKLILFALKELKNANIEEVMALLLPDGQAKKAFENMGFQEVTKVPFYIHPRHLASI